MTDGDSDICLESGDVKAHLSGPQRGRAQAKQRHDANRAEKRQSAHREDTLTTLIFLLSRSLQGQ
jgi:hypothetical protein